MTLMRPPGWGTKTTEGNPAIGELPLRVDGTTRYQDVTLEYPQGKAFVEGFRKIFPDLEDEYFRRDAKNALRNLQEIANDHSFGRPLSDMVNSVKLRINQDFGNIRVTDEEARNVINLAVTVLLPAEYQQNKL